jgi:hypothetical protein
VNVRLGTIRSDALGSEEAPVKTRNRKPMTVNSRTLGLLEYTTRPVLANIPRVFQSWVSAGVQVEIRSIDIAQCTGATSRAIEWLNWHRDAIVEGQATTRMQCKPMLKEAPVRESDR